jgi:hypothetical protein
MERIYVFNLRCYHSIRSGCPIECYHEEGIDAQGDYYSALADARKEFKRRNSNCSDVDNESIEVLDYQTA